MSLGADVDSPLLKQLLGGWGTYKGLVAAVAVCFLICLAGNDWRDRGQIFAVGFLPALIFWTQARWQWWGSWRPKRIRFLVGVYCEDEGLAPQIDDDFTRELRLLIKDGNLGRDVEVVQATRAECRDADGEADLRNLMRRKKALVFVYGRIKRREVKEGHALYVSLKAAVAHAELEAKAQQNFAREISSVFPNAMLQIPVEEQLPQLKVTAEWVGVSTRYMMSLAAGVSGDLDYAEKMLSDAIALLPRLAADVTKRTKINDRLLNRLLDLHKAQAMRSFFAWRSTRERGHAEQLKERLEKVLQRTPKDSAVKQMLATTNFVLTGDAATAERDLRAAMFDNPAVYASLAFALAMQGKYAAARKAYRDAWKRKPNPDLIDQVETFCAWFKTEFPQFSDQTTWCEVQVSYMTGSDCESRRKKVEYLVRNGFGGDDECVHLSSLVSGASGAIQS